MSEKRSKAYRHGLLAESVAALLLRRKGYAIVARRYKTPVGEIDLVALKGKRFAFLEVKRRPRAWTMPAGRCRHARGGASSEPRNIGLPATPIMPATTSPSTWCWRRLGRGRDTSRTPFQCNARHCRAGWGVFFKAGLLTSPGSPQRGEPPSPSRGGMEFVQSLCL